MSEAIKKENSELTVKPEEVLELVQVACAPASKGKIKKGVNEVTKVIERGSAKLVIIASDVTPAEITMHLPLLCDEKKIKYVKVPSKDELGKAAKLNKGCSSIAILSAGEGEGNSLLNKLIK